MEEKRRAVMRAVVNGSVGRKGVETEGIKRVEAWKRKIAWIG